MKEYTIKDLRLKRKLTQEQVAENAGVCKDYISLIERGERNPSDKLKQKLANIYNVSIVQIFLATQRTISTINKEEV